jgi:hypothetical protein
MAGSRTKARRSSRRGLEGDHHRPTWFRPGGVPCRGERRSAWPPEPGALRRCGASRPKPVEPLRIPPHLSWSASSMNTHLSFFLLSSVCLCGVFPKGTAVCSPHSLRSNRRRGRSGPLPFRRNQLLAGAAPAMGRFVPSGIAWSYVGGGSGAGPGDPRFLSAD